MTNPSAREAIARELHPWLFADPPMEDRQQDALKSADDVLAALDAAGWAVVPKEATAAMCEAGSALERLPPITTSQADEAWAAMIAAHEDSK